MDYDKLKQAFNERNPFTNGIGVRVTEAKKILPQAKSNILILL